MLSLEGPLAARLSEVPGLLGVHPMSDLEGIEQAGKPTPCVFLAFDGYQVIEQHRSRRAVRIETRWLVILAVKHAGRAGSGAPARSAAAPLAEALLKSLLGWTPPAKYTPLLLATPPAPVFLAGALFYPLAVTTQQVIEPDRESALF